ncbi:hypothetical protein VNO77_22729 [Canavalia gladiata]|uniref:Uncharacterized protein n=1 Tax=Canavalia gladiata TaxID=3824 RepID=A0AAN9L4K2_CANGL
MNECSKSCDEVNYSLHVIKRCKHSIMSEALFLREKPFWRGRTLSSEKKRRRRFLLRALCFIHYPLISLGGFEKSLAISLSSCVSSVSKPSHHSKNQAELVKYRDSLQGLVGTVYERIITVEAVAEELLFQSYEFWCHTFDRWCMQIWSYDHCYGMNVYSGAARRSWLPAVFLRLGRSLFAYQHVRSWHLCLVYKGIKAPNNLVEFRILYIYWSYGHLWAITRGLVVRRAALALQASTIEPLPGAHNSFKFVMLNRKPWHDQCMLHWLLPRMSIHDLELNWYAYGWLGSSYKVNGSHLRGTLRARCNGISYALLVLIRQQAG